MTKYIRLVVSLSLLISTLVLIVIVIKTIPMNGISIKQMYSPDIVPSKYASREYECYGVCFCDSLLHRRHASSLQKRVSYFVLAFTSLLAAKSAQGYIERECRLQYTPEECPEEMVQSEVVDCEPSDDKKTDPEGRDDFHEELHGKKFEFETIGVIRTPFMNRSATPKSQRESRGYGATIHIFEEYKLGLKDLEGFSYIYVFFVFDRLGEEKLLLVHPRGNRNIPARGVFSTRAPIRPNSIGMSLVRIKRIEGNVIYIDGIDTLDGTPVVDLKPYFGSELTGEEKKEVKTGWFKKKPR